MAGVAAQGPRHASPRRVHEAVRRPGLRASAHGMGRSRGRGFTLLEMLVVMVIIAAAMLLGVMATTGGTDRMQLHSSTKQIAANLRYTRAHAIATGAPQRFTIDPRGHSWQAPNGRHGTVPEALDITFTGASHMPPRAVLGATMVFDAGTSMGGHIPLAHGDTAGDIDGAWVTRPVATKRT